MITAAVQKAIKEVEQQFPDSAVTVKEDGQGGAYVVVDSVDLGTLYTKETRHTWIGFRISFQYPIADVYPHHVRGDLKRVDDNPLGEGMSVTRFEGFERESVQFSRRTKEGEWGRQSAALKLLKVIQWASSRP